MSIQEIINAIIFIINFIKNEISDLEAQDQTSQYWEAWKAARAAHYENYNLVRVHNGLSSIEEEISSWQSKTLEGLWKAYWASETFCRKTLGEIKRLTHLAEDQERSRKGDPNLARLYRGDVERLRSERAKALEVLAKKEARAKERANSPEEAAERAKATKVLVDQLNKYKADHAEELLAYAQLEQAEKDAEEAYNKAEEEAREIYDQIRNLKKEISNLEDLKNLCERSVRLTDRAQDDDDLERALEIETEAQKEFEDKYLETYLEIS